MIILERKHRLFLTQGEAMKDVIKNRIKRLEEIVKQGNDVSLIALEDQDGFHWNGITYANEEALSAAVSLITGDHNDKPLLIVTKRHADKGGDNERTIH